MPKIQTLRSKREESIPTRLMEDSKQELIKQEDGPETIGRDKSSTTIRDNNRTEERFNSHQNLQENADAHSRVSNQRMLTSKKSQIFMRNKNKMSIKGELLMMQDMKELEKDKEALKESNLMLTGQIEEINKEAVKWRSIMSQKIVELEDQIRQLKTTQNNEKNQLKNDYAKDLLRVSKLSKKREQTLIINIKTEIETEFRKRISDMKIEYNTKINQTEEKLLDLQDRHNSLIISESTLRNE